MDAPQAPQGSQPSPQGEPGGMTKLIADTHSNLLKIQESVAAQFPDDGQKMAQVVQAYQGVIDGLGQAPGQEQKEAAPSITPVEAGSAKVQPAL